MLELSIVGKSLRVETNQGATLYKMEDARDAEFVLNFANKYELSEDAIRAVAFEKCTEITEA